MDIIIIGSGPAGVSAALYAARAGMSVMVISKGVGALGKAEKIDNYYGFDEGVSGEELAQKGISQAKGLGAHFCFEEVLDISSEEGFIVTTKGNRYNAKAVILATGAQRSAPAIKGLKEFEGKGVSYCATCDGFFYRKKNVAVIGSREYALHEAGELLGIAGSVTLLTGGEPLPKNLPENLHTNTCKIAQLVGDKKLTEVVLEDGSIIPVSGAFIAHGSAGSTQLARKLGAVIDGTKLVVGEDMSTNIPGLYGAGDCTGGMFQIAKAVYEGAKAGSAAAKFVRSITVL